MERVQEIERSIITTYRKEIWSKFIDSIKKYELIQENDKVMVCISGGKDSFLLAKCIQELIRHGKTPFEAKYVIMNPGYSNDNLNIILNNAKLLGIDIEVFNTDIFEVASKLNPENPCYMCARMRRGYLYDYAKQNGCNKIALGHHFDDVIETTLMSMLYAGEYKTMMPKLHSDNFEGIELIRPLFQVKESSIINWRDANDLKFINCACAFTKKAHELENFSKRKQMKELVKYLKELNPEADNNIFNSLNNINLNCIIGTKKDGNYSSFLDNYNKE